MSTTTPSMPEKSVVLTGITPSGIPHLGNYIGAIKPAITHSKNPNLFTRFFIADQHSLVKLQDPKSRLEYIYDIAATWIALGLDIKNSLFFRQSDVPEIMELSWVLTCIAGKGLLNRAHAYKALVAENTEHGKKDPDSGITCGLYQYPILMAADIIMFHSQFVPVGKDQIQHVEIARDIAGRFNHIYGELLTLPQALVDQSSQTIPGLDGRKMSKSYQNTIPIFAPSKKLRKLIMKIKTNSLPPEAPKETSDCTLFALYQHFASDAEIAEIKTRYKTGIGWGEMKQILFEAIDQRLEEPREKFEALMADRGEIDTIFAEGAEKAREIAIPFLREIKQKIGMIA